MKVLQINKYPSMRGGTERVLLTTTKLLEESGHEVIFFTTDEGNIVHNPTYTIPYLWFNAPAKEKAKYMVSFIYNYKAKKVLEQVIKKEKPDVAHIHLYLNAFSVSILPVLKKYNIPVVMSLHDYRQICPSYLLLDKEKNICEKCKDKNYFHCMLTKCSKGSFVESTFLAVEMWFRRIFYKTEKYVDRFICVSHCQHNKHFEFNQEMADKTVVLYNSSEQEPWRGINRGNYIFFYGRFSREKGINTLLSAVSQLPHVKLKIAGTGLEEYQNIPSNVEFLGFKEGKELQDLVYNSSFVIMPSEWYEPFGLSCLESLALGKPVIASNIGALPEMVTDGKNGYLTVPKNAINLKETIEKALSLKDEEYKILCENAYETSKEFSNEIYIEKLLSVYNEVMFK